GDGRECVDAHPTLCIDGHAYHSLAPETNQRERFLHARMHFITGHYGERWSSKQSVRFNIPVRSSQQCVSRGGETRDVGRRSTCDEPARALCGQMENVLDPTQGDVLECGVGR